MNNNIKAFLESGVIEDYCLGVASYEDRKKVMDWCEQYPAVQFQVEKVQNTLESFISSFSKKAPGRCKNNIRSAILDNLQLDEATLSDNDLMLGAFIGLSRYSDVDKWDELLKELEPPAAFDNIYAKPLFISEKEELLLVWAKEVVPEELHHDVTESFLLLEGTVDCYIEDEVFPMVRGEFMQIPLDCFHKVVVTSDTPGKAIRSRVLI